MGLKIEFIDLGPLDELFEDGYISLGIKFIFGRVFSRR